MRRPSITIHTIKLLASWWGVAPRARTQRKLYTALMVHHKAEHATVIITLYM